MMESLTFAPDSAAMARSDIGFLIIGAQKAGTTSLFEYMRHHPEVHLPPEKEVPFFAADDVYHRGFQWYKAKVTGNAPPGAVCGSACVGDMTGTPFRDIPADEWDPASLPQHERLEDVIPQRIGEVLPRVKLICVLRDPIERALSHYRMAVLNGLESEPFDVAIARLMEPCSMEHARAVAAGHNGYIARGEYGRILSGFLRVFSRDQLKVIFTSELECSPGSLLPSVFSFIGAAPDFVPDNLGKRYRAAASHQWIPGLNLNLWQMHVARVRSVRSLWRRFPPRPREAISHCMSVAAYRVELWNARGGPQHDSMSVSTRDVLKSHFLSDSEALADMLDIDVPWLATWK
jgi:hypothetical protein